MKNKKDWSSRCTLFVHTNDAFDDLWDIYFFLLKKHWPSMPFPIVLNTESKDYSYEDLPIRTFRLFDAGVELWGKRVIEALKRIDTEYVIFWLEDFLIEKDVPEEKIFQCLEWMDEDPSIREFNLTKTSNSHLVESKYEGFVEYKQKAYYKCVAGIAIWRREGLIETIQEDYSVWDWEIKGSEALWSDTKNKYYQVHPQKENVVCCNPLSAIHHGKWVLPVVKPLFESNGIVVDYNKRGIMKRFDVNGMPPAKHTMKTSRDYNLWYVNYILNKLKAFKKKR